MNSLKVVVELFRISGTPDCNGETFSASLEFSDNIIAIIKPILSGDFSYGRFIDLDIDDEEIQSIDEIPSHGEIINFTFLVSQSSSERFYTTANELLKVNKIMRGSLPSQFYLIDSDYLYGENNKPEEIEKIEAICSMITALSKLSHFHDIKENGNSNFYRLVFVLNSESKSSSAVIETVLNDKVLSYPKIDYSLINSLVSIDPNTDLHYDEKINTFRNTLIEYIKSADNNFCEIIKNWPLICNLYRNNLAVYMSAFSFQKARKEIAETEIDYADKISKITTDITNKALAIPISLIGSIAIYQLKSNMEIYITFMGLTITSIIMTLTLLSQKKQLTRITHAKDIVFSSIEDKIFDEQSDIKIRLTEAKCELKKNVKFSNLILDFLMSLSWVPVCIGTTGILFKMFN
ncbi:hypothetical protein V5052_13030 [Klebsiella variicola]|uniref:hypothetical protein n=1 Tax=Klebsiella variicola TaxID=244366 RepID=UPI000E2BDAF4|nr:Uncharacterised protein [Klebsiella variicola]